jgi:cytochrome c biogenesis protein CcmG/thiol:disulfide interchange protein DsbE
VAARSRPRPTKGDVPGSEPGPRSRGRVLAAIITVAAVAFAAALLIQGAASTVRSVGETACLALRPDPMSPELRGLDPDFELPDLKGNKVSVRSLRGQPVLVSFFATWCPPCVEEEPSLDVLASRLGDKAKVMVVSVDEDLDALKRFYAKGSSALVVRDDSRKVPSSFGTSKYPESFLLDASGRVRYAFINKRDWSIPEATACVLGLR